MRNAAVSHGVAGALVVVGEALGAGAHQEGPRRDLQPRPLRRRAGAGGARPGGSSPARAIVWRMVSVCCSSWRRTSSCKTPSPTPSRAIARATRSWTSCKYARASGASSSSTVTAHRAGGLEGVVELGQVGAQQIEAARGGGRATGPRRRRCGRGPRRAGSDRRVRALELLSARCATSASVRAAPPRASRASRRRRAGARRSVGEGAAMAPAPIGRTSRP